MIGVRNKVALIAGGVAVALAALLTVSWLEISSLKTSLDAKSTEVRLTAEALKRADERADANAKAAEDLRAEVDRLAGLANQAAQVRRDLSSFRTTLLERIERAEPDQAPIAPVLADTLGELRDRFQAEGGDADRVREGTDPR